MRIEDRSTILYPLSSILNSRKEWAHMKRRMFTFSLLSLSLAAPVAAFDQKVCESDGEPHRYFLVLASRRGTFYDNSGPAFPMLIKLDGERTQVEAVGTYSFRGSRKFGAVPEESYREFMKEPTAASDVMLRLEITSSQYQRGLKVLREWDRRAKEGALLYRKAPMNNLVLVKEITESLNQCGEKEIRLYKLDWSLEDTLSDEIPPAQVPFLFFKEMRRLNESLHVRDDKFQEYRNAAAKQAKQ
jgi:hypothetical protein